MGGARGCAALVVGCFSIRCVPYVVGGGGYEVIILKGWLPPRHRGDRRYGHYGHTQHAGGAGSFASAPPQVQVPFAAAIYYLVDGCTMKRACERCATSVTLVAVGASPSTSTWRTCRSTRAQAHLHSRRSTHRH